MPPCASSVLVILPGYNMQVTEFYGEKKKDIECAGRKGHFPEADKDPVIQIANMITLQGESKPRVRNIFTLKTCASIAGAEVLSFENEAEMLKAWRDFVITVLLLVGQSHCWH